MAEKQQELREVTKRGFYKTEGGSWRLFEKGEKVYMPKGYKASWTKPVEGDKPSRQSSKPDTNGADA